MGNTMGGGAATGGVDFGQKMQSALENPLFHAGLSVLAANNAGPGESNNPFSAAIQGASRAGQFKSARAEREAFEKQEKLQEDLRKKLQEVYANQTDIGGAQGAPAGLPVPGAPQAAPAAFTQAPGTNAAPGADEIASLMLQYGTPQQQQSAFQSVSADERFRKQLAQTEAQFERSNSPGNRTGRYNPRDYTTESWARFLATNDPSELQRYERVRTYKDADGLTRTYDATSGQDLGGFQGVDTVADNKRTINRAAAQGTGLGRADVAAKATAGSTRELGDQIGRVLGSAEFDGAVGPIDARTGKLGEALGTKQGVLGGEIERLSNKLVSQVAAEWKGAISERELQFFMDSVPRRSNSAATWKSWYKNEFLPMQRRVEENARGLNGGAPSAVNNAISGDQELVNRWLSPGGAN